RMKFNPQRNGTPYLPGLIWSGSLTRIGGLALACGLLLAGCARQSTPSALQPAGPAAAGIARLSWLLFGMGALIYLAVVAFLLYALFRSRRQPATSYPHQKDTTNLVIIGGVAMPAVTLV